MYDVSVVIPTQGRASLGRAVESAKTQVSAKVEIILVYDLDPSTYPESSIPTAANRVVFTGGGRGGSGARNLGIKYSTGNYIAFLDDDDEWLPDKLIGQLVAAEEIALSGRVPIIATRVRQRLTGTDQLSAPTPSRLIGPGEEPENYLFRGRRVGVDRPLLATSTILTTSEFARLCAWDESLSRHQDWDWLVRASKSETETVLMQLPQVGAIYAVGSAGSISAKPDWRVSYEWVSRWRDHWDEQTWIDFVYCQVFRYALQARDWRGMRELLKATRGSTPPNVACVMGAVTALIPRGTLERVALRSRPAFRAGAL